jgi:hypothetical protein
MIKSTQDLNFRAVSEKAEVMLSSIFQKEKFFKINFMFSLFPKSN